jgi:hypothetical protein
MAMDVDHVDFRGERLSGDLSRFLKKDQGNGAHAMTHFKLSSSW